MTSLRMAIGSMPMVAASLLLFGISWWAMPDLVGILRNVMMVFGGLVVIAIVLVVSVAIISGVMGMLGKLRKKT